TGDPEKIAAMAKAFRIYFRKGELEDGGYTMDHTDSVMLLNRDDDFYGTTSYEENSKTAIAIQRALINEGRYANEPISNASDTPLFSHEQCARQRSLLPPRNRIRRGWASPRLDRDR